MSPVGIIESHVEEAMLGWLGELGCEVAYGPDVEPEKPAKQAFNQLQTYKQQTSSLFTCNELLAASDGIEARHGTLPLRRSSGKRRAC